MTVQATEDYEFDMDTGWVAAGQPTEARVREVVAAGALVLTLRRESENEPFDEQALVEELGGTFVRHATAGSDIDDASVRNALYDRIETLLESDTPVYFHCGSSNRIGAIWALYLHERKGVDATEALEQGKAVGLKSLEERVAGILGLAS